MVCASSTSGMSARCTATAPCPYRWLISKVTKLITPKPMASGLTSGPKLLIAPRAISLSSRACTVPRATARRRDSSSTPMRGSAASIFTSRASSGSSWTDCIATYANYRTNCADCPAEISTIAHSGTRGQPRHMTQMMESETRKADVFPVKGVDYLQFLVGNAKQAAHYYSSAFGMTCVGYRGPEQGYRDHAEYVLVSGSARFLITGAVHTGATGADHVTKHSDGIYDIALAVPDVDAGYRHAISAGARS